jgi:Protein containing von Willebrand factor type A (vWA) domain
MQQTLEDFYKVVRSAGIKVSVADSIETSKTVELVGYGNRSILKDALTLSLAKTVDEKEALEECFEQFFTFNAFQKNTKSPEDAKQTGADQAEKNDEANAGANDPEYTGDLELAKMLLKKDKASLAQEMSKAAREAGMTDIWFFYPKRDLHPENHGQDGCPRTE